MISLWSPNSILKSVKSLKRKQHKLIQFKVYKSFRKNSIKKNRNKFIINLCYLFFFFQTVLFLHSVNKNIVSNCAFSSGVNGNIWNLYLLKYYIFYINLSKFRLYILLKYIFFSSVKRNIVESLYIK